jgi:hypothetical protein
MALEGFEIHKRARAPVEVVLRYGLAQQAGLAGSSPAEDQMRTPPQRDPQRAARGFYEALDAFFRSPDRLRQIVLESVDLVGVEVDVRHNDRR